MDLNEYQEFCKRTAKKDFKTPEEEIMCWGLGICGEAGDVASCIKKTFAHKNNQQEGVKENLGDALWYSAMICNFLGWNMEDILKQNIEKLKKRFPEGFTYENAQRSGTKIKWGGSEDNVKEGEKNG